MAKNYYYKILQNYGDKIIHIEIPQHIESNNPKIIIKPLDMEEI